MENFLEEIKCHADLARAMYLPMPRKQKSAHMEMIQEKVEKYTPLIEEKTGIRRDKLKARRGSLKPFDLTYDFITSFFKNLKEADPFFPLLTIPRSLIALPFILIVFSTVGAVNIVRNASLSVYKNNLYVHAGFSNRMELWEEKYNFVEISWDKRVVHEISHNLWNKLKGSETLENAFNLHSKYRELNEGFAHYCAIDYFKDLYPDDQKEMDVNTSEYYNRSASKIEKIVNGGISLLDIPKIWIDLAKVEA